MSGVTGKPCVFCQIARSSTSTILLYSVRSDPASNGREDRRVPRYQSVGLQVILVRKGRKVSSNLEFNHIATVNDLRRTSEDYQLVKHMLNVGQTLLHQDAPQSNLYRFGFHRPPFNSVNHLHLHCLALPFTPRWKTVKYTSLGPLGGFIEAEKLLEKLKPQTETQ